MFFKVKLLIMFIKFIFIKVNFNLRFDYFKRDLFIVNFFKCFLEDVIKISIFL